MSDLKQTIIEDLKRHEGLELKPYTCKSGKLTIGYGRNLEANGICEEEAELMLFNDFSSVTDRLDDALPFLSSNGTDETKAILINMAFNMGVPGLLKFTKTLALVEKKDYVGASREMLDSKWARQVGKRATELSWRMAAQATYEEDREAARIEIGRLSEQARGLAEKFNLGIE